MICMRLEIIHSEGIEAPLMAPKFESVATESKFGNRARCSELHSTYHALNRQSENFGPKYNNIKSRGKSVFAYTHQPLRFVNTNKVLGVLGKLGNIIYGCERQKTG